MITGASAGIGRALARRFARDGASIALLARGVIGLAAVEREVRELGGRPLAISLDVADADAVDAAAARIEQELGPIDIWINNAGVTVFGPAVALSPAEVQRVSDVTYLGAVWGTMAALKRMRTRGRGTIVQVGSGAAYRAIPLHSAYSAAKHALRGFTESLRVELRHDGIDVHLTMVHPSAINTPIHSWSRNLMPRNIKPFPPIYQPEVAAATIHWAAHARRRDVYLGWTAIGAVVANQLAPGLTDRVLAWVGYEAQQLDEPVLPNPLDNLFQPVEGDFGARGRFNDRARSPALLAQFVARWGGIRAMLAAGLARLDEGRQRVSKPAAQRS